MQNKDWTGNMHSVFNTLGASNHCAEEREENDYYATDPIAIDVLIKDGGVTLENPVFEPSCGEGHLAKRLQEYGYKVIATDLIDRGFGKGNIDFFSVIGEVTGSILTNPPYNKAYEFIEHGMELLKDGNHMYMFLKLQFLEGKKRKELFKKYPPKTVYVCSSRIICAKNGDFEHTTGSAVAYAWYEFEKGFHGDPIIKWIN